MKDGDGYMAKMEVKPKVIVDVRESYLVRRTLAELDTEVVEKTITPADYVLSGDFAVERKRFRDFLRSIFDGRLFEQVQRLAKAYGNPVLVVEGDLSQAFLEISNPLVFWGALAKVVSEWNLSVVFTLNERHTAMFLYSLAKKLQEEKKKPIIAKHKPRVYTLKDRQLLVLQTLPNIGPERAEKLLERFGSVRKVFQASEREILSTEGLGRKTVQQIRELLDTRYRGLEEF